jgi:hypothetical protein
MSVDPTLRLSEFQRLDEVSSNLLWVIGLWIRVTAGLTALALLLSLAGIYAVLSFTVAAPDGRMKTAPFPFAVSIRRRFHSPFPFALSIRRFHPPFPVAVWQRVSRSFRPLCHAAILRPEKPERIPINQLFP